MEHTGKATLRQAGADQNNAVQNGKMGAQQPGPQQQRHDPAPADMRFLAQNNPQEGQQAEVPADEAFSWGRMRHEFLETTVVTTATILGGFLGLGMGAMIGSAVASAVFSLFEDWQEGRSLDPLRAMGKALFGMAMAGMGKLFGVFTRSYMSKLAKLDLKDLLREPLTTLRAHGRVFAKNALIWAGIGALGGTAEETFSSTYDNYYARKKGDRNLMGAFQQGCEDGVIYGLLPGALGGMATGTLQPFYDDVGLGAGLFLAGSTITRGAMPTQDEGQQHMV